MFILHAGSGAGGILDLSAPPCDELSIRNHAATWQVHSTSSCDGSVSVQSVRPLPQSHRQTLECATCSVLPQPHGCIEARRRSSTNFPNPVCASAGIGSTQTQHDSYYHLGSDMSTKFLTCGKVWKSRKSFNGSMPQYASQLRPPQSTRDAMPPDGKSHPNKS